VLLGGGAGAKGDEVPALAGLGVLLPGVETIPTVFQLSDHTTNPRVGAIVPVADDGGDVCLRFVR